jgi:hypothetical protein
LADTISIEQLKAAVRAVDILTGTVQKHDELLRLIIGRLEVIEKRLDTVKSPRK